MSANVSDAAQARLAPLASGDFEARLFANGYALVPGVLTPEECCDVRAGYEDDTKFRSRVIMEKHNFGRGEYRYFAYPLPPLIEALRNAGYAKLAPLANRWMQRLDKADRFPLGLQEMLALCTAHDQTRPTALILKYGAGDFNCLHQDLYGEIAFPLQMTVFLNEPGTDYTGGEFVLAETRPRSQTRVEVLAPRRGDLLVFTNRYRPVASTRGMHRATVRHGVSVVRSGERYTLGIILHDAQ